MFLMKSSLLIWFLNLLLEVFLLFIKLNKVFKTNKCFQKQTSDFKYLKRNILILFYNCFRNLLSLKIDFLLNSNFTCFSSSYKIAALSKAQLGLLSILFPTFLQLFQKVLKITYSLRRKLFIRNNL